MTTPPADPDAEINAAFTRLFDNGEAEVGLEAGTDPGLAPHEWVAIPKCMIKAWAVRVVGTPENLDLYDKVAKDVTRPAKARGKLTGPEDAKTVAESQGKYGWAHNGTVVIVRGRRYLLTPDRSVQIEVDKILQRAPTGEDARNFYTVNKDRVRPTELSDKQQMWAHSLRFWSAVGGFLDSTKSVEYTVVDNPTTADPKGAEFADFATKHMATSYTAIAARAGNWRKSNHATGGEIATGFADRWLRKEELTSTASDPEDRRAENKVVTTMFYVGTHAASVHTALALFAPRDPGHWAEVNPRFGLILNWTVGTSARDRLEGMSQVAGAAMVADSVATLRLLVRQNLSPLLQFHEQIHDLVSEYHNVEKGGVACATYAKWFLDGYPPAGDEASVASPVMQKETGSTDLMGELAYCAIKFFKNHSLGKSPSLAACAAQLGDPTAETTWSALAAQKKTLSSSQIAAAYGAVRGASAATTITNLLSDDEQTIRAAVAEFNTINSAAATLLSVKGVSAVGADLVVKNRGAGKPTNPVKPPAAPPAP